MKWRLIRSPALSGAMNMAIDEAMLISQSSYKTPPTLRLYEWSPPAVSLGLLQPIGVIDKDACQVLGFDLVRRPSGGRAVIHQYEVTYAIVVDGDLCPDGNSVLATYRWLSQGLVAGLRLLGIDADIGDSTEPTPKEGSFCFVRLTGADLHVRGKKIGGSAQARKRQFVLQHGSIPLRFDKEVLQKLFGVSQTKKFTCIEDLLSSSVSPNEFSEALIQGFSQALGCIFEESQLTTFESFLSDSLMKNKYQTLKWLTERKALPMSLG